MPISDKILPLLNELITNYQKTSVVRGLIYKNTVDPNFATIYAALAALPELINNNPLPFNNETLYDYTLKLFGEYEETNSHFATNWRIFSKSYRAIIQELSRANTTSETASSDYTIGTDQGVPKLDMRPDGEPDGFTRDLMQALSANQQSLKSTQKAHTSELALLNRKLAEAQRSSRDLAAQNERLKEQIKFEQTLKRLQPEFDITREQLLKTAELFQALADLSRKKPELIPPVDLASLTPLSQEQSNDTPVCSSSTQTKTQNISTQNQPITEINITPIRVASVSSSTLNMVPPPPPPPPIQTQAAMSVSPELVETITSSTKNKEATPCAKPSFFGVVDELKFKLRGNGEDSSEATSQKRLQAIANLEKKN